MTSFIQRQTDGLDHGTYQIVGVVDTFAVDDNTAILMGREDGVPTDGLDSGWFRFDNVTIPQGAIITSAKLTFQATSASQPGSPNVEIFGFDEDDTARIANADPDDYLARARTTASVTWTIEAWTSGSADHDTPDIAAVVQEIISRAGWVSGNALAITVEEDGNTANANNFRRAVSVDNAVGATGAPQITINYDIKSAILSGSLFATSAGTKENHIRYGGGTLIITLTNAAWDSSLGANNTQTQALINGLTSESTTFVSGWNAIVKPGLIFSDVVRTSATVATITFPAFASYNIDAQEIITCTIDSTSAN